MRRKRGKARKKSGPSPWVPQGIGEESAGALSALGVVLGLIPGLVLSLVLRLRPAVLVLGAVPGIVVLVVVLVVVQADHLHT